MFKAYIDGIAYHTFESFRKAYIKKHGAEKYDKALKNIVKAIRRGE